MNKVHNPISRKVEELRNIWAEARDKQPDKPLIRVLMHIADIDLLNALLKWESSEHGALPEVFVILFSPFDELQDFSYRVAQDFIDMYRIGAEKDSRFDWNYHTFSEKLATKTPSDSGNHLLISLINAYKDHLNMPDTDLVIGFIPQYIRDMKAYNNWLHELLKEEILEGIKFMVLDHQDKGFLAQVCDDNREKAITIDVKNMQMHQAIEAVATAGNPNNPQVLIRTCMFEMGKCMPNKKDKLQQWGEKLLKAGQRSGDPTTYASTYLIYAGYVMHFRDEKKAASLIDTGIQLAKKYLTVDDKCLPVYIQLLGYKAANLTMNGKHQKAVDQFLEQAKFATASEFKPIAISAYKTAIYLSDTHQLPQYETATLNGYEFGKSMTDQELGITEYSFIAYHYLKQPSLGTKEDRDVLQQRMIELYGKDWQENMKTLLSSANFKRKESTFNLTGMATS